MKRKYIKPIISVQKTETINMIASSELEGTVNDDFHIGYGSSDNFGSKTPASMRYSNIWDEDYLNIWEK